MVVAADPKKKPNRQASRSGCLLNSSVVLNNQSRWFFSINGGSDNVFIYQYYVIILTIVAVAQWNSKL